MEDPKKLSGVDLLIVKLTVQVAESLAKKWADTPLGDLARGYQQDLTLESRVKILAAARLAGMYAPSAAYTKQQFQELMEAAWDAGEELTKQAVRGMERDGDHRAALVKSKLPIFQGPEPLTRDRAAKLAQTEVEEGDPPAVPLKVLEEFFSRFGDSPEEI